MPNSLCPLCTDRPVALTRLHLFNVHPAVARAARARAPRKTCACGATKQESAPRCGACQAEVNARGTVGGLPQVSRPRPGKAGAL